MITAMAGLTGFPILARAGGGGPSQLYRRFVVHDPIGSGVLELGESGSRVQTKVLRPFGGLAAQQGLEGATPYGQRFAGHRFEENSGFYYMNARWMDAEAGRFVSVDPLVASAGRSASHNGYSYVENNPSSLVDPSGQAPDIIRNPGTYNMGPGHTLYQFSSTTEVKGSTPGNAEISVTGEKGSSPQERGTDTGRGGEIQLRSGSEQSDKKSVGMESRADQPRNSEGKPETPPGSQKDNPHEKPPTPAGEKDSPLKGGGVQVKAGTKGPGTVNVLTAISILLKGLKFFSDTVGKWMGVGESSNWLSAGLKSAIESVDGFNGTLAGSFPRSVNIEVSVQHNPMEDGPSAPKPGGVADPEKPSDHTWQFGGQVTF